MARFAALGLSHSPLIGKSDPDPAMVAAVDAAVGDARRRILEFDPELVVVFAPDHYNGFFYKSMPPFCLGTDAVSVGDFGSEGGRVLVDEGAAKAIARGVLERDVDLTVSARMTVDHGLVQPLETLFGGIAQVPVVPVFVNGVAAPLGPMRRVRALGSAVGEAAALLDRRVLFLGSGGLSHDPPVPVLEGAPPRVAEALIEGLAPTAEQRERGEARVVQAGRDFAAGTTAMIPLNAEWDRLVMDVCASGDLRAVDSWSVEWMGAQGGGSAHEVRTWVAAFAALAAHGTYSVASRFYAPIPEWIAGFGVQYAETS